MTLPLPLTSDERRTALANIAARREQIAAQLRQIDTELRQMYAIEAEHTRALAAAFAPGTAVEVLTGNEYEQGRTGVVVRLPLDGRYSVDFTDGLGHPYGGWFAAECLRECAPVLGDAVIKLGQVAL